MKKYDRESEEMITASYLATYTSLHGYTHDKNYNLISG